MVQISHRVYPERLSRNDFTTASSSIWHELAAPPVGWPLKFVLLQRLKRRRAAPQSIVFGDAVKDVNAAVMQQGWLRYGALGLGRANRALLQRPLIDFLNRFKAMPSGAFVFVKWHS